MFLDNSECHGETYRPKLGELLCDSGVINNEQLTQALSLQRQKGGRIGGVLVDLGFLSVASLVEALQQLHQVRALDLATLEIPSQALRLLPLEKMRQYNVVPLQVNEHCVHLAMADPGDLNALKELGFQLGRNIQPIAAPCAQIKAVLRALKQNGAGDRPFRLQEVRDTPPPAAAGPEFPTLKELCRQLMDQHGSDLLMSAGAPPSLKKNGEMLRLAYPKLTTPQMAEYARGLLNESQKLEFERAKELDFSCIFQDVGRFRANLYQQRGSVALSIRSIIEEIPSLADLGLPAWLADYALRPNGLILIGAPTGQGKSMTVAALVDLINTTKKANIVTIEDPIEYHHRHKLSNVNQREVGVDTESFHEGLKRVFRQAPDVIVIGEIRDPESAAIAIQAASTGHLVISTVHSSNATTTVERIIDIFPPNHQHQIRVQLAESLLLVLDQRLVPAKNGKGQVLAYEKLVNSLRVRALIRDGKTHQIRSLLQHGSDDFTCLDAMLAQLCREGRISREEGLKHCDSSVFFLEAMVRVPLRG
jgi:twitching motility protein PilT